MGLVALELQKELGRHLRAGHPWVFSKALAQRPRGLPAGAVVDLTEKGQFVARGYYDPHSPIAVRVLTREAGESIDEKFWRGRVERALALRRSALDLSATDCFRVLHGESDFLPGVVVDLYAGWAVVKLHSAGLKPFREALVGALRAALGDALRGVFGRAGVAPESEDSDEAGGASLWGPEPPERLEVREHGVRFLVDVRRGQKTGFFLDQRDNRAAVRRWGGTERALNCFAYSGGFSVQAALGGAREVVSVDLDADALDLARENFRLNGLDPAAHSFIAGDVTEMLGSERREGRSYGLVVLDPPAFARSQRAVESALQGYAALNRAGAQLVGAQGVLCTASCSARVSQEQFFSAVKEGAFKARVDLQLIEARGQPPDHPVSLQFPEGRYLKFLVLRRPS
jgi:23S rRNA (cytosine1962-C5)-methyltransferase